jgi:hypothetical protein
VITGTEEANAASLETQVAAAHNRARMLVLAILLSIVVCVAIGLFLVLTRSRAVSSQLPYSLYFASVMLAFASIFLRRTQMRPLRLEVVAGLRGIEGLLKHFFLITVVGLALADAIGVLALVAGIQGGDQSDVVRLGIVALVVAVFAYPRRQAWQRAAEYFAATPPAGRQ